MKETPDLSSEKSESRESTATTETPTITETGSEDEKKKSEVEKSSDELARLYDEGAPPGGTTPPTGGGEPPDGDGEDELGGRMTFLEHLDELRKRILYSIGAVFVGFVACWIFREEIFLFLSRPILDVLGKELIFTKPTEPFTIYLKVSFVAGIFLTAPILMLQLWLFIAPALYRKEKGYAIPFLVSSTLLFVLGGVFAYYVILPPALYILIHGFGRQFEPMISAVEFFSFQMIIIIGMGIIFQMPILIAFLSLFGLITPGFLIRNFRYALLLIVIVAAVVSPTGDPFNLMIWSAPMLLLYTIGIGISWVFQFRRDRQEREEP